MIWLGEVGGLCADAGEVERAGGGCACVMRLERSKINRSSGSRTKEKEATLLQQVRVGNRVVT